MDADNDIRDLILKLASDSACVLEDKHAKGNMLAWNLTRDDICQAICDGIRSGDRVKVTTVKKHPKVLAGQPAYEIKHNINANLFYIRMTIFQPGPDQQALLIVSVHLDV